MKKVYEYWMPDCDEHFEGSIAKRIKKGGPAQYQYDVRDAAYKYVTDFDLVVDVGANVGLWAKHLAERFNKVIAFEPINEVYECLELNVKGLNVDLYNFALGEENNTVDMFFDHENVGASYIKKDSLGTGSILIKKLDDLNLPKFGMIKLDCETYELQVLKGATETILKYKPILIVEQHAKFKQAGEYLKSLGAIELTSVRKDYIFGW